MHFATLAHTHTYTQPTFILQLCRSALSATMQSLHILTERERGREEDGDVFLVFAMKGLLFILKY